VSTITELMMDFFMVLFMVQLDSHLARGRAIPAITERLYVVSPPALLRLSSLTRTHARRKNGTSEAAKKTGPP
jgi:NhaP-type Na+/H+ and K+/H+ antiporter